MQEENKIFDTDIDFMIEDAIENYKIENSIDDIRDIIQSEWNFILKYIFKAVFKGTNILKVDGNEYDINKVNYILDLYIDLCYKYGKEISIIGFSRLTGISEEIIQQWGSESDTFRNGKNKLSHKGVAIYQKLNAGRQESLSNRLLSGKSNPVGTIAILNHAFGWSSPYVAEKPQQTQRIARGDIQKTIGESSASSEALPQLPS